MLQTKELPVNNRTSDKLIIQLTGTETVNSQLVYMKL